MPKEIDGEKGVKGELEIHNHPSTFNRGVQPAIIVTAGNADYVAEILGGKPEIHSGPTGYFLSNEGLRIGGTKESIEKKTETHNNPAQVIGEGDTMITSIPATNNNDSFLLYNESRPNKIV